MTTTNSYNITFKLVADYSGINKNVYRTNMNVFQASSVYRFVNNDDDLLSLYITFPHSGAGYFITPQ
jgi:hypothetical protein